MTKIRSLPSQPRRPGALGIHSIDHFNLVVPDLAPAAKFYTDFGLEVRAEGESLGLYAAGQEHRWGRLTEGPAKRLNYVSFGCYSDDFDALRARLARTGIEELDPPAGFETNGAWFRDPDGSLLEIRVGDKTSPNEKSVVSNASAPSGVMGSTPRSRAPFVRPRRLAHVLVFARDIGRSIRFYEAVLGLRLSDRAGDGIAFMHGVHGSDHHLIAFVKSDGPGLHHLSWDVPSINDVGLGAMQMADRGHTAGWGMGRHVLGSNFFHYVRDPWGSYSEYSSDIDYVPAECDWAAADHPVHDAFYVWGPVPPTDFAVNHELSDA